MTRILVPATIATAAALALMQFTKTHHEPDGMETIAIVELSDMDIANMCMRGGGRASFDMAPVQTDAQSWPAHYLGCNLDR